MSGSPSFVQGAVEEVKDHVILWLTDKLVMAGSACLPVDCNKGLTTLYTAPSEMYHKVGGVPLPIAIYGEVFGYTTQSEHDIH